MTPGARRMASAAIDQEGVVTMDGKKVGDVAGPYVLGDLNAARDRVGQSGGRRRRV